MSANNLRNEPQPNRKDDSPFAKRPEIDHLVAGDASTKQPNQSKRQLGEASVDGRTLRDAIVPGALAALGLVAIVGLAGRFGVPKVERHLSADIERHVITKTLGVQIRVDGRDAILNGHLQTPEKLAKLRSLVGQRWGVRTVSTGGVVIDQSVSMPASAGESPADSSPQGNSVPTIPVMAHSALGAAPTVPTRVVVSTTLLNPSSLTVVRIPASTQAGSVETVTTSTAPTTASATSATSATKKPPTTTTTTTTSPTTTTTTSPTTTSRTTTTRTTTSPTTTTRTTTTTSPTTTVLPITSTTTVAIAFDPNIVSAQIDFVLVDQPIEFVDSSVALRPSANVPLDLVASLMAGAPEARFAIEVHTDGRGAPAKNLTLSKRRGEAIRTALLSRGVSPQRLLVDGRGEAEPIANDSTLEGQAANRRVSFVYKPLPPA